MKILEGKPHYPVIRDANGVVLSLPPIINGEHSKITLNTKNVLIEVTATDYTKAMMGLTIITTAFSLYSSKKFEFEQVKVVHPDGKTDITPHFNVQKVTTNVDYMNKLAGIKIDRDEAVKCLTKMGYRIVGGEGDDLVLEVPLFRTGTLAFTETSCILAMSPRTLLSPTVSTTSFQSYQSLTLSASRSTSTR